jgi:hypothetical protein
MKLLWLIGSLQLHVPLRFGFIDRGWPDRSTLLTFSCSRASECPGPSNELGLGGERGRRLPSEGTSA